MQRRRALQVLGTFAALPALRGIERISPDSLSELGERVHRALDDNASAPPRALTPAQYRTVTLAAEHIIPRTDTPGATDARVADFVDVMLADWYAPADRDRFLSGLADLDVRTKREYGHPFADCSPQQRVASLTTLDNELAALRQADARAAANDWFAMLKFLTVWGYYTSRVGITEELRTQLMPGRYDGNASYVAG